MSDLLVARLVVMVECVTIAVSFLYASSIIADDSVGQVQRDLNALESAGVAANADGAIQILRRMQLTDETKQMVAHLISDLGHESYVTREKAKKTLEQLGRTAESQLLPAAEDPDLEIAVEVRRLLELIRQDQQSHDALLSAALRVLGRERHPQTVNMMLAIIPLLESRGHVDQASMDLWLATTPKDANRIRLAIQQDDLALRLAAIPALELASGDSALSELRPFLSDPSESIRLAAVRALIDRLPKQCMTTLIELLESDDTTLKLRAAWLISLALDESASQQDYIPFRKQVQIWKRQCQELDVEQLQIPLGERRLQLDEFGSVFREEFALDVDDIKQRYGELQYETTVAGARASAHRGIVRLHGDHDEGDQRLFITAQQLIGEEQITSPFVVSAEIGGEAQGSGTYHVGISIGNLRVLFHPGYRRGGFRIERVDNHRYMIHNQSMTFTPAAGSLHKMHIRVTPQRDKNVKLDVTIIDAQNSSEKYSYSYLAKTTDIGALTRIGVERSGRTGGAAIIGNFQIDTVGLDRSHERGS